MLPLAQASELAQTLQAMGCCGQWAAQVVAVVVVCEALASRRAGAQAKKRISLRNLAPDAPTLAFPPSPPPSFPMFTVGSSLASLPWTVLYVYIGTFSTNVMDLAQVRHRATRLCMRVCVCVCVCVSACVCMQCNARMGLQHPLLRKWVAVARATRLLGLRCHPR